MSKSSAAVVMCRKKAGNDPFAGIDLGRVSECLRAFAHPDRLRLVAILLNEELSVSELAKRLGRAQPTVSGHLRILQGRGMLACRREGHRMYYMVAAPALADICSCIRTHFGTCAVSAPTKGPR